MPMKKNFNLGKKLCFLYQKLDSSVAGKCLLFLLEIALTAMGLYWFWHYGGWLLDNYVDFMGACGVMAWVGIMLWIAALVIGAFILCWPLVVTVKHFKTIPKKGTV